MKIPTKQSIFVWLSIFSLTLLLAANASAGGAQDKVELTLKSAMAMAIRNNIELRVRALDSSMAKVDMERSRGLYDPLFSASSIHSETFYTGETYGTEDTTTRVGLTQYLPTGGSLTAATYAGHSKPLSDDPDDNWTDWYTSVGVTLVQPLLKNFGKETTELNITLADSNHQGSLENFRDYVIDTVYSVLTTYHRLYVYQQEVDERKRALVSAQALLATLESKPRASAQKKMEISNTEYAISQRLKELVDIERRARDKEAKLRYLIGMEEKSHLFLVDAPFRTEPLETEERAVQLAMELRPDLKQLRLELAESELQERVAKRKLMPNLALSAGTGFRGIEDTFSESVDQIKDGKGRWWSAGLQFSMPLGNTVAKSDYRRRQLRTRQLKNQITDFEWRLRDYIQSDMRSLISARVQMQVADKANRISEQRLEQYRKNHKLRSATLQDVLNAENDQIDARNNQIDAQEDFANAVALLWKDAGVLLERLNINIDTTNPEQLTAGTERVSYPVSSPQQLAAVKKVTRPPAVETAPKIVKSRFPATAKPVAKPVPAANQEPKLKASPVAEVGSGGANDEYTLKIGEYASSELAKAEQKLVHAGLTPLVTAGSKQSRQVTRLKVGDYRSQQLAQQQLQKIRKYTAGGFIIYQRKTGYRLYAGSFFSHDSAQKEQRRLVAHGIDLTLEETAVTLPTSLLTAGRFQSREAALVGVLKLKKLGLKAVVQKRG